MTDIPRDRWQRPLVVPPEGGEAVAYTRVSTLAKVLDDQNGLMAWKQRKVAEGLVRRPDLLTRIAGALSNGDPDTDWDTKKALTKVCAEACEAAGSSRGSSSGTGLHELTEAYDRGLSIDLAPAVDRVRLDAYIEATSAYTVVDVERFVVNDTVRAAGTFDRLLLCPDGFVRVADVKTGKSEADYPLATTMQIAIYANGLRYDPDTGERTELHPDLVDLSTGLLIHLPASGGCQIIPLDLVKGWAAAQLAARVHHGVRRWRAGDIIRQEVAG